MLPPTGTPLPVPRNIFVLFSSVHPVHQTRVVDPDPDSVSLWIRIRIGNPDPGARKLRNFSGKMHFSYFIINLPLRRCKLALTTF
jgi:hypothetical protein